MRVVISQPMYLPWVGFLAQMAIADVYIWLDDTQFSKGSFTNRIQVKIKADRKWMSIPLKGKGTHQLIRDLETVQPDWRSGHRSLLEQSLRSRPYVSDALSLFDQLPNDKALSETLIASSELLANALGALPPQRMRSTDLQIGGRSWERVLELVKAVGGTQYISGAGGLAYIDHEAFEAEGVAVHYMDYAPVPWPQGDEVFTPYVTGLDLVASVPASMAASHLNPRTSHWRDVQPA